MIGTSIAQYRITAKLGEGGMGVVYRATDTRLGREVAIKLLSVDIADDPQRRARFLREARAASALRSSPEINLVLRKLCSLLFSFPSPPLPARSGGERSEPERRAGRGGEPLDGRSDLFSLGVVLYQMSTGRLPFQGSSFAETVERIGRVQPDAIARFNYEVTPELERIIRKCMEKKPGDRYQSARELLIDFRRLKRDSSTQLTPAATGRHSWNWWAVAGAAGIVLLLGVGWWIRRHPSEPGSLRFGKSVAVLPFRADGGDMAFFVDGLGEELANALGKGKQFDKVPPWSSSSSFRDHGETIRAIAEKLQVSTLLEGRIQKAGSQLHISATLIDPFRGGGGAVIWSDNFEHNGATSVPFAIQDQIARSIARSLRVELAGGVRGEMVDHYTKSPEAYEYYHKGRLFWKQRGVNLMKAEQCLKLALLYDSRTGLMEDSTMAPAFMGLADVYNQQAAYGLVPKSEVAPHSLYCIRKALEIDPHLAEAYATLGWFEFTAGHAVAAERAFEKALELDYRQVKARYWYSCYLWCTRQFTKAREQALKALNIDPVSESTRTMVAWQLTGANYPESARDILDEVIRQHPDFTLAYYVRGLAQLKLKDPAAAIGDLQRTVELAGRQPFITPALALAQVQSGQTNQARATISTLKPEATQGYELLNRLAILHLILGEKEQCYTLLERSVAENDCNPYLAITAEFEVLYPEPRFIDLVKRSGLLIYDPKSRRFTINRTPRDPPTPDTAVSPPTSQP